MSGILPNWMQHLLGIKAVAGEGTSWSIECWWSLPSWLTFLLTIAVVFYVIWLYFHESAAVGRSWKIGLAAVRLAILAIVLVMISRATLILQRTGLPYVAVVVDDSQSMGIVDDYDEKIKKQLQAKLKNAELDASLDRLSLAKSVLLRKQAALLRGIAKEHKLRIYSLTTGAIDTADYNAKQSDPLQASVQSVRGFQAVGPVTRLGASVTAVLDDLRGTTPAAIVLLSDGINTEGASLAEAASAARRRGVPLLAVGTGDRRPLRDLKLSDLLVDDVVFVDDIVSFECKLSAVGYEGRDVEVRLTRDGEPEILASRNVQVGTDGKLQTVRLQYRPQQEGKFRYRVEVKPLAGEMQTKNNSQERDVWVRDEKIRVLLAAGYPNYEYRYLRNLLARENTVELETVLQDADPQSVEQDAARLSVFPLRREDLFSYDVIMLDDVNEQLLDDSGMNNLVEFVSQPVKGGALIIIAGPQNMPQSFRDTPLATLLPVKLADINRPPVSSEGFVAQPTDLGLANAAMQLGETPNQTLEIWQKLPPLYWMLSVPEVKMGTRVLAVNPHARGPEGRPLPLICLQYVGAGKVLFHTTDETWRWRWRAGDEYFGRYWLQMIRYLSRSKLSQGGGRAVLSTDRREYRGSQLVRIRLRFTDPRLAPADDRGATVVVEQRGHKTRSIVLHRTAGQGVFEGVLSASTPGQYHVWLSTPRIDQHQSVAVDFEVLPSVGEFENTRMDAAALRQAAEETQGRFYSVLESGALLKDLPPGRQVPMATLPPHPLWNRWPLLVLLLGLLIGEWVGRKMQGMA